VKSFATSPRELQLSGKSVPEVQGERRDLIEALRGAADDIQRDVAKRRAAASSARNVQEIARDILVTDTSDDRLLLNAYLLDLVIDDIFEHVFGGTHYNDETEALRFQTCSFLMQLMQDLSASLQDPARHDASAAWQTFVYGYLSAINKTNKKF
jgi:hypothetical protein